MFLIVEIQTQEDGSFAHLEQTAATYEEAMSKWHGVLQFAAVSNIPIHSCSVINSTGIQIATTNYRHSAKQEEMAE